VLDGEVANKNSEKGGGRVERRFPATFPALAFKFPARRRKTPCSISLHFIKKIKISAF
jgi:hypothetical protein